jgi:mono/diheme cytochrome c family protein
LLAGFVLAGSILASGLLVAKGAIAAEKDQQEELAAQARGVLRTHCHRCHKGKGSEGGDLDYLDVAALTKAQLIQPGAPDRSRLMQRVAKAEMPPRPDRLYAEEAEVIRRWIAAGAPAFAMAEAARQQVGLEAVLTAVRDHLRQAPSDDRPYFRFFTLHNLANDPRASLDELRSSRAALSKVLNSLSWNPKIHVPRAIDEAQVVFAIKLALTKRDGDTAVLLLPIDAPLNAKHFATVNSTKDLARAIGFTGSISPEMCFISPTRTAATRRASRSTSTSSSIPTASWWRA